MATIYRKTYPLPMPPDAEIIGRRGRRVARWVDGNGNVKTAPVSRNGKKVIHEAGCWYARYRDASGRPRRVSTGCEDEQAARKVLSDLLADVGKVKAGIITPSHVKLGKWVTSRKAKKQVVLDQARNKNSAGLVVACAQSASGIRDLRLMVSYPVYEPGFRRIEPGWHDGLYYDEPDDLRGLTAETDCEVILGHCRCSGCLNFSQAAGEYFCSEDIGGTAVVWATGERLCDPPPDAWHYCARCRGPQVSKDVWVWPRASTGAKERPAPGGGGPGREPTLPDQPGRDRSDAVHSTPATRGQCKPGAPARLGAAQVGAGSDISAEPTPPYARRDGTRHGRRRRWKVEGGRRCDSQAK